MTRKFLALSVAAALLLSACAAAPKEEAAKGGKPAVAKAMKKDDKKQKKADEKKKPKVAAQLTPSNPKMPGMKKEKGQAKKEKKPKPAGYHNIVECQSFPLSSCVSAGVQCSGNRRCVVAVYQPAGEEVTEEYRCVNPGLAWEWGCN